MSSDDNEPPKSNVIKFKSKEKRNEEAERNKILARILKRAEKLKW